MAQHYKILRKKEPEIYSNICKIIEHNTFQLSNMLDFDNIIIEEKNIMKLSSDYNSRGLAFTIGRYDLNIDDWDDMAKNVVLEVHCDEKYKVRNVFYPL